MNDTIILMIPLLVNLSLSILTISILLRILKKSINMLHRERENKKEPKRVEKKESS